jgi:hypothetical protein
LSVSVGDNDVAPWCLFKDQKCDQSAMHKATAGSTGLTATWGASRRDRPAPHVAVRGSTQRTRKPFKRWLTQFVPAAVERSTFVLCASLALILLFWQWRPIPPALWEISNPPIAMMVTGISLFGWFIVLLSTFLINHFELFGLYQVINNTVAKVPNC